MKSINGNSFIANALRRGRSSLNRHGYDFHPIDSRCWDDQKSLLADRDNPIIFDVGANLGKTADKYRTLLPSSRVYCFEAQADLCAEIGTRFINDRQVSVYPFAVGAAEGVASFYLNAKRDTSSLLPPDSQHLSATYGAMLRNEGSHPVKVITIDSFASSNNLPHIEILKLDIQGGELDALAGAKTLLSEKAIDLIYCEVYFVPMYTNQPLLGDLAHHLAQWNYRLHLLYDQTINGITGRPLWGDAIFVSPRLQEASRERLRSSWIK